MESLILVIGLTLGNLRGRSGEAQRGIQGSTKVEAWGKGDNLVGNQAESLVGCQRGCTEVDGVAPVKSGV